MIDSKIIDRLFFRLLPVQILLAAVSSINRYFCAGLFCKQITGILPPRGECLFWLSGVLLLCVPHSGRFIFAAYSSLYFSVFSLYPLFSTICPPSITSRLASSSSGFSFLIPVSLDTFLRSQITFFLASSSSSIPFFS